MEMTNKEKKILAGIKIYEENETVRNPFSGEEVELCPEAVAIYDVIKGCEITGCQTNETLELFYAAREVFIKNWPDAYMKLLD